MIARYAQAGSGAALVTIAALWIMQALISIPATTTIAERVRTELPWVRVPPPEDPPPVHPLSIESAPPPPPPAATVQMPVDPIAIRMPTQPGVPVPNPPAPTALRLIDGPLVSITYVQPVYPSAPLSRGEEGWVLVEFDVTAAGTVRNVRVVDSSSRAFERSAIRAAAKFRFKPQVVDGEPRPSAGIRNMFRFRIE